MEGTGKDRRTSQQTYRCRSCEYTSDRGGPRDDRGHRSRRTYTVIRFAFDAMHSEGVTNVTVR